jgi:hypothetical protein
LGVAVLELQVLQVEVAQALLYRAQALQLYLPQGVVVVVEILCQVLLEVQEAVVVVIVALNLAGLEILQAQVHHKVIMVEVVMLLVAVL